MGVLDVELDNTVATQHDVHSDRIHLLCVRAEFQQLV